MSYQPTPLEFLSKTQTDPKVNAGVAAAMAKGAKVTMEHVMKLAKEEGFNFTDQEFREAVKRNLKERFTAGETRLANVVDASSGPESACSYGCLSYTYSWHPLR